MSTENNNSTKILKRKFQPREYQLNIAKTAIQKNTLCILPTGMGKTYCAMLVAADRIARYPNSKVLITAPTRPLSDQLKQTFENFLNIEKDRIVLLTGKIKPEERKKFYQHAKIVSATPQCLDGKTEIFVIGNGPIPIEKFFEKLQLKQTRYGETNAYCTGLDVNVLGYRRGLLQEVRAIKAWKILAKRTIRITTELKIVLECTPEHPLLTIDKNGNLKWTRAEKLSEGMYIAMAKRIVLPSKKIDLFEILKSKKTLRITDRKLTLQLLKKHKKMGLKRGNLSKYKRVTIPIDIFLNIAERCNFSVPDILHVTNRTGRSKPIEIPAYVTPMICYIVGGMLGDGHIANTESKGREVVFSALDKKSVMSKFEDYVFKSFGIKPKKDPKKGLIYHSTALAEVLISLGVPPGKKSSKIRVPSYIFESDERSVYSFISGLFDTDGNASKRTITISSVSSRLIKDIRWLLLKVGIPSSITTHKSKPGIQNRSVNTKMLFTLTISGEKYLTQLLRKCDFDKSRCKTLIESLKNIKRKDTRSKEILPVPNLLREAYKEHRNNGGSRLDEVVRVYSMNTLSHNSLRKIILKLKSNEARKITKLMKLPIRWIKIKSIRENTSPKWVYDLTVEGEHNFIANWVINHNTVQNDLKTGILNLSEFSLLIVDECHRTVKRYPYPYIAKKYMLQSKNPLILGLTASPGSTYGRIDEICKNLFIKAVEIRTEVDKDVKPYVKPIEKEWVYVDFPEEFEKIKSLLKEALKDDLYWLKEHHYLKAYMPSKKDLLKLQGKVASKIKDGTKSFALMWVMIKTAEAIKIDHAIELLETQGITPLYEYFEKLSRSKKRTDKRLMKDTRIKEAANRVKKLYEIGLEHPKLEKLEEIVKTLVKEKPNIKIIIFANFRATVDKINQLVRSNGIKSEILIGQATRVRDGLSQEKQIETLKRFGRNEFNVLVGTSISEEGLSIPAVDYVIFYESVPSEIRMIQRRGRTGRTAAGKVIFLITKGTRDEGYYWAALRKEKKMKGILYDMKEKKIKKVKKKLTDWLK